MSLYSGINTKIQQKQKQFAVLVDPDKVDDLKISQLIKIAIKAKIDFFLVGGSLLTNDNLEKCISTLKKDSTIPVILFPGNTMQVSKQADAILLLSLISGRNPELLIGKHVIVAPFLKNSNLEIIPTGYMLIDCGTSTTAAYMSNTAPIPSGKNDVAMCTAMAGEMLGLKLLYMDAGSGATHPVTGEMISKVKQNTSVPLFVGGGICTKQQALDACRAGADVVVIGNAIEKNPLLIEEISNAIHQF